MFASGWAIYVVVAYLLTLVGLGFLGKKAQKKTSLSEFYLAGRSMGFFVLVLTLFATQYSGNTLVGFTAKAYRSGFVFLVSVPFMIAVIAAYLVYAPKLYELSQKYQFITPGDFIRFRFRSRALLVGVNIIFVVVLCNYIISNLKAMGFIVEMMSGQAVSFAEGIVFLSIIMVIYETLGGMRSVAWTDVIQGVLLFLGCVLVFFAVVTHHSGEIVLALADARPEWFLAPSLDDMVQWGATLVLIAGSISIYPQAIQRIFAAQSEVTLKRSLQVMAVVPFFTTLLMILLGIIGNVFYPGLSTTMSEKIMLFLLQDLSGNALLFQIVTVLFLAAVTAAIMSTIDSALLSMSSIVAKDMLLSSAKKLTETQALYTSKVLSWLMMAALALFAIYLPQTIWKLVQFKLELLIQVAPCLFLGIHSQTFQAREMLFGLLGGTLVAITLTSLGFSPLGVYPGLWGLLINVTLICQQSSVASAQSRDSR